MFRRFKRQVRVVHRMLGDLLKIAEPETTVWISNPSYVNHRPVMEAAGLKVRYYHYFNPETRQVDSSRKSKTTYRKQDQQMWSYSMVVVITQRRRHQH